MYVSGINLLLRNDILKNILILFLKIREDIYFKIVRLGSFKDSFKIRKEFLGIKYIIVELKIII